MPRARNRNTIIPLNHTVFPVTAMDSPHKVRISITTNTCTTLLPTIQSTTAKT